jgi:hypothetical protein
MNLYFDVASAGLKLTVIGSSKPDAVHAKYPDVAVCPVDDVIDHPDGVDKFNPLRFILAILD